MADTNIGSNNIGGYNNGSFNVGYYNEGSFNNGSCNVGSYNDGSFNRTSHAWGHFNTIPGNDFRMFNKLVDPQDVTQETLDTIARLVSWYGRNRSPVTFIQLCELGSAALTRETKERGGRAYRARPQRGEDEPIDIMTSRLPGFDQDVFKEVLEYG